MSDEIIGHWRLGAKLGEGSFGAVYEADNTQIAGRRAAVKLLHAQYSTNEDVTRRFINEASAASRADHENIIQVFDGGTTPEGQCYLVCELLKGSTLGQVIASGHVDAARVIRIGSQIARALASAHRAGIVHRDLKPDNVFLVRHDDNPDFVKVLDFGVAQLADARGTLAGVAVGTPSYMSPEQWEAKGTIDGRADVYALGLMLYELLAGRRPFEVRGDFGWMMAHRETPPPVEPLADVAPELRTLVVRMLAKRPTDRPQTMEDVARSLELALLAVQPPETFTIQPDEDPAHGTERWALVVEAAGKRRVVPMPKSGELTIGFRKGNLLRLDAADVAPWHAKIARVGSHFLIEEREGAPVLVNGQRLDRRSALAPSDRVAIGGFKIALQPADTAGAQAAAGGARSAAWVAAGGLLAAGLLLGGSYGFMRFRAAERAEETAAQVARLNVEVDHALKSLDWDGAIARADEGLKLAFADETLRDKRARATKEKRSQPQFDEYATAAKAKQWDRAVAGFRNIPESSVYRQRAQALFGDVQEGFVEDHLEKARALQAQQRCADALHEVTTILSLDEQNAAAQAIARACAQPAPPAPEAAPEAAPAAAPAKPAKSKSTSGHHHHGKK